MSNIAFKLCRFDPGVVNVCYLSGYRIMIQAEGFGGVTSNIFLYSKSSLNPYDGTQDDIFQTVAGPVDLEEWPELEPDPELDGNFFRKSYIDVVVRSTREVEEIWEQVKREVCILQEAICRLDQLRLSECFWCPGPPDDVDSSSSESSSGSADSASSGESVGSTDSFASDASSASSDG